MAFHNVRLPVDIELGSTGGARFKTTIVSMRSGHESRNQTWQRMRIRRDVGYPIRSRAEADEVLHHWMGRRGNLHSFPFRDWTDYQVEDEVVATVSASTDPIQLIKTYEASGPNPYVRNITKPEDGVVVKLDGATQVEDTDYSIDLTTGIVTPLSAWTGEVSWTGNFLVPVRYDVPDETINMLAEFDDGTVIDGLFVYEVRE